MNKVDKLKKINKSKISLKSESIRRKMHEKQTESKKCL